MSYFDPDDFISCQSWASLCDHSFDRKNIPPSGVVYCPLEHIHEFFATCRETTNRYVIVSASSDFGLHEQKIDHPNKDLWKVVRSLPWDKIQEREDYLQLPVGPCCEPRFCLPSDTYSVKYYNFTQSTFSVIPPNIIRWFCTNVNINHPEIECIPFGVNDEGNIRTVMARQIGRPKKGLLYVNFQPHTEERLYLRDHYWRNSWPGVTVKKNCPVEEFWRDVAEHEFILCPAGIGLDCYRTWEALYLGSTPILKAGVFASHFSTYPVAIVDDLFGLSKKGLEEGLARLRATEQDYNWLPLTLSYWRKRINLFRPR